MIDILYLSALIILPLIGLILLNYISIANHFRTIAGLILFFIIHNILFVLDYSLRGDNIDYIIFSLEYPFILLFIISLRNTWKNIYTKILKITGMAVMILGMLWSLSNVITIFPTDMDYASDKKILFTSNDKTYEVRRYSFGFATLINTRYTFETYRAFEYLPFEHLIDRTVFWDNKEVFNIPGDLQFDIRSKYGIDTLAIKLKGVEVFKKRIGNYPVTPVYPW